MPSIYYKTYYHVIWSTKYGTDSINEKINKILYEAVHKKIKEQKGSLLEFNSYLDHCHCLCVIPPKISASDFVGQIKGYSSYETNRITNEECLKWQRGFGILTLSEKGVPFVKKYIQNQEKHHQDNSTVATLEFIPRDEPTASPPGVNPQG